ncbi:MAG: hypothetical protein HOA25_18505 [Gammaproteobacteria bacterium]|jgi:hypothetical protein|nr:hypothetical protein [Gammaproteobacteria bacterium]
MNIKSIVLAAALTTTVGCVSSPSGIAPSFVDPQGYASLTCEELIAEKGSATQELAGLSDKQDSARARATAYNFLLIVGSGALVKDRSDEIGSTKGSLAAIDANLIRRCSSTG